MRLAKHHQAEYIPVCFGVFHTKQLRPIPFRTKQTQSGVVLFVALITLVVMSLAAVALIRSVDTNSVITGNLSYKQTAAISSSFGLENMADTIGTQTTSYSEANHASDGYYATCVSTFAPAVIDQNCSGANLTSDASWQPGVTSRLADGVGVGIAGGVDAYGNTIQYIVERMCNVAGVADETRCLSNTTDLNNDSKSCKNYPCDKTDAVPLPIYRVTIRVAGPKNTLSFIQAFIS